MRVHFYEKKVPRRLAEAEIMAHITRLLYRIESFAEHFHLYQLATSTYALPVPLSDWAMSTLHHAIQTLLPIRDPAVLLLPLKNLIKQYEAAKRGIKPQPEIMQKQEPNEDSDNLSIKPLRQS